MTFKRRKPSSARSRAIANGYRSGLEDQECARLSSLGINYSYESHVVEYTPAPKKRKYTPDIILLDNGIVVEMKGYFKTADRSKHLSVKAEHPDLDLRFVFSNSRTRISKQSKTTYALWCESHGFLYADKEIPLSWLREGPTKKRLAALAALRTKK